jgi:hypothetical protein
MATVITHRGVRIVTLEPDETLKQCCSADDIALCRCKSGWLVYFVSEDGAEGYEDPFPGYQEALWAAKAAAEFAAE